MGIPGVGKSTLVAKVVELLGENGLSTKVVNYGSVMMQQATKLYNISSRDEMRKLSVETQRNLQVYAAAEISKLADQVVIVDTHLFISTSEGYWPGMPMDVLQALKPTNLVLVVAKPEEIMERRKNDTTRARDTATRESLLVELEAAISLFFASSLVMGCPALVVENPEGPVEPAASKIIAAISS